MALITALGLSMLMLGVGVAVDIAGASSERQQLQSAVDSAALAVALSGSDETENRKAVALAALETNFGARNNLKYKITEENGEITIVADTAYDTLIMGMFKHDKIDLSASATVPEIGGGLPVEVALVLDTTGSMGWAVDTQPGENLTTMVSMGLDSDAEGSKIHALKTAATSLVNDLEQAGGEDVRVGIVPFANYVAMPDSLKGASWLDSSATGTQIDRYSCQTQELTNPDACGTFMRPSYVDGAYVGDTEQQHCPAEAYTQYDPPKCTNNPVTLAWYGCVGSRRDGYERMPEWSGRNFKAVHNTGCTTPILPLTDNFVDVRAGISALKPNRDTYLPIGLAWGWRMLDPAEPLANPYGTRNANKALVLMTDGSSSLFPCTTGPYHQNNSSGAHINELCADVTSAERTLLQEETLQRARDLCAGIKADGIRIYTIAFSIGGADAATTKALIQSCASSSGDYFDVASAGGLFNAFETIGNSIYDEQIRILR